MQSKQNRFTKYFPLLRPAAVLINYQEYARLKPTLEGLSDPNLMEQIIASDGDRTPPIDLRGFRRAIGRTETSRALSVRVLGA